MNGDFPQTYSAEPDVTATPHGNIDELIMRASLQELLFIEAAVPQDEPFERFRREFTEVDPRKLVNLIEQLDFSATGFSNPKERKEYILRKLRRGDKPGGAVSYKTPGTFYTPTSGEVGGIVMPSPKTKIDELLDVILPQADPDTLYYGQAESPEEMHSRFNQPDYLEELFGPDDAEPSEYDEEFYGNIYGMPYEDHMLKIILHELFHLPRDTEKYPGAYHETYQGVEGKSQEWYGEFVEEPLLKQVKEIYPVRGNLRKLVDDILSPVK